MHCNAENTEILSSVVHQVGRVGERNRVGRGMVEGQPAAVVPDTKACGCAPLLHLVIPGGGNLVYFES